MYTNIVGLRGKKYLKFQSYQSQTNINKKTVQKAERNDPSDPFLKGEVHPKTLVIYSPPKKYFSEAKRTKTIVLLQRSSIDRLELG